MEVSKTKYIKKKKKKNPDMSPLDAQGLIKKLVLLLGFELLIEEIWISQK
jgi:hypothetical protein